MTRYKDYTKRNFVKYTFTFCFSFGVSNYIILGLW